MIGLTRRGAAPLLRQVGGRQHASSVHHEDQQSPASSPLSNPPNELDVEDFTRSPEGSSEEDDPIIDASPPANKTNGTSKNSSVHNIHGSRPGRANQKKDKAGLTDAKSKTGLKRKSPGPDDEEEQPDWILTSSQPKRPKTTYGSQSQRSQASFKKVLKAASPKKSKASFKRLSRQGNSPKLSPSEPVAEKPAFRRPVPAAINTGQEAPSSPLSHPASSSPLGSPIGSPAESDIEEVFLGVPNPSDFSPCPICSEPVSKLWRIDWELEHLRGRRMNLRMQEKFCQAHKEKSAAETWEISKYPTVDWTILNKRLAKQRSKIEEMLTGQRESMFRTELEKRVKTKESKTAAKSIETGGERGKTGYYGSRGAKVMTEYALKVFAPKLRKAAGEDKLMASSGVAGGISGYVQAVIVPELAIGLIMEDMGIGEQSAKEVLEESEEIGDLVNAEEEDKVVTKPVTPPPTYGED
ncbi:RTC4-like domain-containing protein [Elsinoe ampelina]|uniref:Restriction of telomere capping protein 4 n=1 Tax=Elsinoe ampelina TaxID=302913 RepID=A0A6A6GF79_9PEZI|nr:RTC4-like domain-containing protein [Elsinoe ampelina]